MSHPSSERRPFTILLTEEEAETLAIALEARQVLFDGALQGAHGQNPRTPHPVIQGWKERSALCENVAKALRNHPNGG